MTTKRGLGRAEDHRIAWEESYPHPLVSCMMPGIAVLAICAMVLLGLHLWQNTLPADTRVPMLEGMKQDDAFTALSRAGLNAEVVKDRQASETIPAGYVITAAPASGQYVKSGRIVRLVISSGSSYTTIPDVRELPQAVASERLRAVSLIVSQEEYINHKTIPFDRVVSISPRPGARVLKMSSVELTISKGPETPVINSFDGQNTGEGSDGVPIVKSTVLTIILPTDDEPRGIVRIDISDDYTERTIYQKEHKAGDKIVQTVQGTGDVIAKVYYGDQLILTRTF